MEERTGNDALSKQTASSVFPPLADERNTAGKQLFKNRISVSSVSVLLNSVLRILTISHSLQVVPCSFLLSSFLRTTATCANAGCLIQRQI